MVKFLIHRPVAVIMSFIALVLLGIAASTRLPVALMPDIQVPVITVQAERKNTSARELESTVVTPLRRQLLQVSHLDDINSVTRNNQAVLKLKLDYGTDVNYAFIEVNEKIDMAMAGLPRDVPRPRVIKASVTDIPVFYLNIFRKDQGRGTLPGDYFLELSEFADAVIRKRIEQLPEVAMADVTGLAYPELYIRPDKGKMAALNVTGDDIHDALKQQNLPPGNLLVREGHYLYKMRFSSMISTPDDVANIYLKAGNRILKLKEVAEVGIQPQDRHGMFLSDRRPAVSLAIIQQTDARMADLKDEISGLMKHFREDYPQIGMELVRDQSAILDYSISNLKKSLLLGAVLAFLVMFLFLKDGRSPWLVGLSIPVALIISLLVFHLAGLSINIISLSGLILGVGLMLDNSIIVIDNITQFRDRGTPVDEACVLGTNEVIRPLISSALTTCAVFVPLIFLSGLAGALFFDQAVAVSTGLFVSLGVSITLLPALYFVLFRNKKPDKNYDSVSPTHLETFYESGLELVFHHRGRLLLTAGVLILLAGYLFIRIPKDTMPQLPQNDLITSIDWNENITLEENLERVGQLTGNLTEQTEFTNSYLGEQQFILQRKEEKDQAEAEIYWKTTGGNALVTLKQQIAEYLTDKYPIARYEFHAPGTVFEQLFSTDEPLVTARVTMFGKNEAPEYRIMKRLINTLESQLETGGIRPLPIQEYHVIQVLPERMLLYGVSYTTLVNSLQTAFHEREVDIVRSGNRFIPIVIQGRQNNIDEVLNSTRLPNAQGEHIPVSALVKIYREQDYKQLYAGKQGEFVPLQMDFEPGNANSVVSLLRETIDKNSGLDVLFTGRLFSSKKLIREMILVLSLSLLLLYFILAAQFESLTQPFIVLLEIPIDIAGCLLMLLLFGATINIMSLIGMIVMTGIIINDSILKVDTINHLRPELPLYEAIRVGGIRRLKPILMTTITTILALMPFLFGSGLGVALQRPLALTVIGGLALGTLVSLYFIPVAYGWLYRKGRKSEG